MSTICCKNCEFCVQISLSKLTRILGKRNYDESCKNRYLLRYCCFFNHNPVLPIPDMYLEEINGCFSFSKKIPKYIKFWGGKISGEE